MFISLRLRIGANLIKPSNLANTIKPQVAIPIHYGSIVGTKEDGEKFNRLINKE